MYYSNNVVSCGNVDFLDLISFYFFSMRICHHPLNQQPSLMKELCLISHFYPLPVTGVTIPVPRRRKGSRKRRRKQVPQMQPRTRLLRHEWTCLFNQALSDDWIKYVKNSA